jgi:hypothetical protein
MNTPRTTNVIAKPINDPKFLGMNGIMSWLRERIAAARAIGDT